jgi:exodeoxyribonuclease VII large subunit
MGQIRAAATAQVTTASQQTLSYRGSIEQQAQRGLNQSRQNCVHLRDMILLQHPARVLQQGYVMLKDAQSETLVTSVAQLQPTQTITLLLKDGQANASITGVQLAPADISHSEELLTK